MQVYKFVIASTDIQPSVENGQKLDVGDFMYHHDTGNTYIYTNQRKWEGYDITLGGAISEMNALNKDDYPNYKTVFIVHDKTAIGDSYLLTKDGWRLA